MELLLVYSHGESIYQIMWNEVIIIITNECNDRVQVASIATSLYLSKRFGIFRVDNRLVAPWVWRLVCKRANKASSNHSSNPDSLTDQRWHEYLG